MFAIPTVEIRRLHFRTNSDGGGSKHDEDQMTMSRREDGSRAVWKLTNANGKLRFKSCLKWAYWRHPVIQADLRQCLMALKAVLLLGRFRAVSRTSAAQAHDLANTLIDSSTCVCCLTQSCAGIQNVVQIGGIGRIPVLMVQFRYMTFCRKHDRCDKNDKIMIDLLVVKETVERQ